MDSDDGMHVEDNEPINWPIGGKGKGKGKATARDEPYDDENLPWYARVRRVTRLRAAYDGHTGWRSTGR